MTSARHHHPVPAVGASSTGCSHLRSTPEAQVLCRAPRAYHLLAKSEAGGVWTKPRTVTTVSKVKLETHSPARRPLPLPAQAPAADQGGVSPSSSPGKGSHLAVPACRSTTLQVPFPSRHTATTKATDTDHVAGDPPTTRRGPGQVPFQAQSSNGEAQTEWLPAPGLCLHRTTQGCSVYTHNCRSLCLHLHFGPLSTPTL